MSEKTVLFGLALIFPAIILAIYYCNYTLAVWLGVNQDVAYILAAGMTGLSLYLIGVSGKDFE